MKTYEFYDTCALLLKADDLWENPNVQIVISSITLNELENIKSSYNKDADIKYSARKILNELDKHLFEYRTIVWNKELEDKLKESSLIDNNDSRIIISAKFVEDTMFPDDKMIFFTNDLCCKYIAHTILKSNIASYFPKEKKYDGFKKVYLDEEQMSELYCNMDQNLYNLLINEYLIVFDVNNPKEPVDRLCWTGTEHRHLIYDNFNSGFFGNIKPIKGDYCQALAFDSLCNNQITMIRGAAGTGKTTISLAYLLYKLERNQIDKIIIFCNTVATKNSARLGFYPGERDAKLLDSQIGNLLISKLGDRYIVEQMMADGKLVLLPMSDIRGYDTSGMRAGIYISEAQNLDIELMRLALQRVGSDSICIIDGDSEAQVDDIHFAGRNNGMRRASEVFRDNDIYGEITLKTIHRSRIAELAQKM